MKDGTGNHPPIHAQRLRYDLKAKSSKYWLDGDAITTSFFNSLSVSFSLGEAFFIHSIRPWQTRIKGQLRTDIAKFIRQETDHCREHGAFNCGIEAGGYDTVRLKKRTKQVLARMQNESELTKLTYSMCCEHLTAILSAAILRDDRLFTRTDATVARLWLWHSVEEVEHKAVCFDTWLFATQHWSPARRWLTRSLALTVITAGFVKNRFLGQLDLLRQDGWTFRQAFPALVKTAFRKGSLGRSVVKDWLAFLRPGFHPWQIDDRALVAHGQAMLSRPLEPVGDVSEKSVATPKRVFSAA